jgi:plastocyanin
MLLNTIAQFCCAFFIFLASAPLYAIEVTIIDRNGLPVSDAVISISDSAKSPQSLQRHPKTNPDEPHIMDQIDFQFVPKTMLINKGDWVDFPNSDDVRHHVYSFSATKPFEIKMFTGSEADPIQFTQSGIVVLGCNIHDSMVGYIYVTDSPTSAITNVQGVANIPYQDAPQPLHHSTNSVVSAWLWHPLLSAANTDRIEIQIDTSQLQQTIVLDSALNTSTKETLKNGFSSKFRDRS